MDGPYLPGGIRTFFPLAHPSSLWGGSGPLPGILVFEGVFRRVSLVSHSFTSSANTFSILLYSGIFCIRQQHSFFLACEGIRWDSDPPEDSREDWGGGRRGGS